ncbi:MAG: hypothetical protein C0439_14900 [Pseudomonas sp.]|nr:hypothetical protein [Pseudomonas sp.]
MAPYPGRGARIGLLPKRIKQAFNHVGRWLLADDTALLLLSTVLSMEAINENGLHRFNVQAVVF